MPHTDGDDPRVAHVDGHPGRGSALPSERPGPLHDGRLEATRRRHLGADVGVAHGGSCVAAHDRHRALPPVVDQLGDDQCAALGGQAPPRARVVAPAGRLDGGLGAAPGARPLGACAAGERAAGGPLRPRRLCEWPRTLRRRILSGCGRSLASWARLVARSRRRRFGSTLSCSS